MRLANTFRLQAVAASLALRAATAQDMTYTTSIVTECFTVTNQGGGASASPTPTPGPGPSTQEHDQCQVGYTMPACARCDCATCTPLTSVFTTTFAAFCTGGTTSFAYTVTETYAGLSALPQFPEPTPVPFGFTTAVETCEAGRCGTQALTATLTYPRGGGPFVTAAPGGNTSGGESGESGLGGSAGGASAGGAGENGGDAGAAGENGGSAGGSGQGAQGEGAGQDGGSSPGAQAGGAGQDGGAQSQGSPEPSATDAGGGHDDSTAGGAGQTASSGQAASSPTASPTAAPGAPPGNGGPVPGATAVAPGGSGNNNTSASTFTTEYGSGTGSTETPTKTSESPVYSARAVLVAEPGSSFAGLWVAVLMVFIA
ncbi:hypothetical protein F4780DRAFT_785125 [Xylariomycetidae sp. FL0641]|nr:hypothetical protein F4780DRAFT_785125 [Xylariomycetidae sp. FL0641]